MSSEKRLLAGLASAALGCSGTQRKRPAAISGAACTHARSDNAVLLCYRCPCFLRRTRKSPQARPGPCAPGKEGRDFSPAVSASIYLGL